MRKWCTMLFYWENQRHQKGSLPLIAFVLLNIWICLFPKRADLLSLFDFIFGLLQCLFSCTCSNRLFFWLALQVEWHIIGLLLNLSTLVFVPMKSNKFDFSVEKLFGWSKIDKTKLFCFRRNFLKFKNQFLLLYFEGNLFYVEIVIWNSLFFLRWKFFDKFKMVWYKIFASIYSIFNSESESCKMSIWFKWTS